MTRVHLSVAAFLCFFMSFPVRGELEGFFPLDGGRITVRPTGDPINAAGIQFIAEQGSVTAGETPAPFQFFVSRGPEEVVVANLGSNVRIEGALTLDVVASEDAVISGAWGKGTTPAPFPVFQGNVTNLGMKGSFPYDGGPVTIAPISIFQEVVATNLSIEATTGTITSGGNATPFANLDENTSQKWAVSSSNPVTIAGPVTLDLMATVDATLSGQVGDGTESSNFSIARARPASTSSSLIASVASGGGPISLRSVAGPATVRGVDLARTRNSFEFVSGSSAAPFSSIDKNDISAWAASSASDVVIDGAVTLDVSAIGVVSANSLEGIVTDGVESQILPVEIRTVPRMRATIPTVGGPITIAPRGSSSPLSGIMFNAQSGTLTSGGNPAPFDSIATATNTTWSALSSNGVVIEGPVTLDVAASDSAVVTGSVNDGVSDYPISVSYLPPSSTSRVAGRFPSDGGNVIIENLGDPVALTGISIRDRQASLSAGNSPAPFETVTHNTPDVWTVRSDAIVTLDGTIQLDVTVGANGRPTGALWDENGQASTFNVTKTFSEPAGQLRGWFPEEGGKITVSSTNEPIRASGIEFIAAQGSLTQGDDPSPFQFFVTQDNPEHVLFGSLATTVLIDGNLTLDVVASADAEVLGNWGNGPNPVLFEVNRGEPNQGGGGGNSNVGHLEGYYSLAGGPVSIYSLGGPVSIKDLSITASEGSLDGGDNAAPFESVTESSETQWTVSSSADVIIDGLVQLDVSATEGSVLGGLADGQGFQLNALLAEAQDAELIAIFPEGGGPITLLAPNGEISTSAITFQAADGQLVGGTAEPFGLFVSNTDDEVVLGSLGSSVTIDKPIQLDVHVTSNAQILGSWGDGVVAQFAAFSVAASSAPPVPEPNSGVLALFSALGLFAFRNRRCRHNRAN